MFGEKIVGDWKNLAATLGYILLSTFIVFQNYYLDFVNKIEQLERSGEVAVEQAADRLSAQYSRYITLANYLAEHPSIVAALDDRALHANTGEILLRHALATGTTQIDLVNAAMKVIATSHFEDSPNLIGSQLSPRSDFSAAFEGRLGTFRSANKQKQRIHSFVRSDKNRRGAVAVKLDMFALEYEWRIDENIIAFFDEYGVAFSSNRPELVLTQSDDLAHAARQAGRNASYEQEALQPFPVPQHKDGRLWQFQKSDVFPKEVLVISKPSPRLNMSAYAFLDTNSARVSARRQAILWATLLAFLGLVAFVVTRSRQRLRRELELEEASNAELERRVALRSQELKETQDALIQASKLNALGQMSAAVSHELNQPLAAIQNFAENAKKLIDRERVDAAKTNLDDISGQIGRMSRIIGNLRAFARKEVLPIAPVDFASAVKNAVLLMQESDTSDQVTINMSLPDEAVFVRAGQVRLEQVISNILNNAVDAVQDADIRQITIELSKDEQAQLLISDSGSGIAEIDRVFEPFYTTKEMGASKGLGLGMAISHGTITSFGGTLSARNRTQGGAEFIISLPLATANETKT